MPTFIEVIEKFNPYHDSRGRFASSHGATSMTFRTDYGPGQKAIDNLKEKGMAGAAAAKPVKKPAAKPEKKPAEQAAGGDKPTMYTSTDNGKMSVALHTTETNKKIIEKYEKNQRKFDLESDEETNARLAKSQNSNNWKLSKNELSSVVAYTESAHHAINAVNRTGKVNGQRTGLEVSEAKAQSRIIEKAINRTSLGQDMVLYRGAGMSALGELGITKTTNFNDVNWQNLVGKTFTEKSFTSTSANRDSAFKHKPVSIRYYAPKGANAASVAHVSSFAHESEVLINKGVEFKVMSIGGSADRVMMSVLVSPGK